MKKVISFSLWGDDPKYTKGAVKNATLAKSFYPGWETWFYCGESVSQGVIEEIADSGGRIFKRRESGEWTGTFWRFEPIADSDVEVMISRDTDSRLSQREVDAVSAWLKSGKLFHVMRDHPAHGVPILAGMWGARKPILGDILHLMESYRRGSSWETGQKQLDQNFLRDVIWPRVAYSSTTHDEIFSSSPFPAKRMGLEFVGQVYDESDIPNSLFADDLKKFLVRNASNSNLL
jgi:hypothetical protein